MEGWMRYGVGRRMTLVMFVGSERGLCKVLLEFCCLGQRRQEFIRLLSNEQNVKINGNASRNC